MDDPRSVRLGDGAHDWNYDVEHIVQRRRSAARHALRQRHAFEPIHHAIVHGPARLCGVQLHDVRIVEQARFVRGAYELLRGAQRVLRMRTDPTLDRHALTRLELGGAKHISVCATAEPARNPVTEIKNFTGLGQGGVHGFVRCCGRCYGEKECWSRSALTPITQHFTYVS